MSGQRVFTLEEARSLLPRVAALVDRQMTMREDIEEHLAQLSEATGLPPGALDELPTDSEEVRARKSDLQGKLRAYQRGWNDVEDLGAVVKDPRIGLLDFYSRVEGKLVFLCWRHGETEIGWFHPVDTGFSARRPIEGAVRARLYN